MLDELPGMLDTIDAYIADGVLNGERAQRRRLHDRPEPRDPLLPQGPAAADRVASRRGAGRPGLGRARGPAPRRRLPILVAMSDAATATRPTKRSPPRAGTSSRWSTTAAPSGRSRSSTRPRSAPRRSPSATAARSPSSTPPGSPRRCASSSGSPTSPGAPAPTPRCLLRRHALARGRRADAAGARALGEAVRRRCCSSTSSGTSSTTSGPRSCSRRRRARLLRATTCGWSAATARTSSPSPRSVILTETSVTGPGAFSRLFTEQTSAITVDLPDAEEPLQLMEALSRLPGPRPRASAPRRRARSPRRSSPGCAPAPSSSTRCSQDKATKDRLRSLRPLARGAQPRQRGLRRVGRGADRGGDRRATSSPGAGTG